MKMTIFLLLFSTFKTVHRGGKGLKPIFAASEPAPLPHSVPVPGPAFTYTGVSFPGEGG